jgi:hypothetical protein
MIQMSLDALYEAFGQFWQASERQGIDIILFTASFVRLSAVTL